MRISLVTARFNITDKQLNRFSSFLQTYNKETDTFLIGGDESDQDLFSRLITSGFKVEVYPCGGSEVNPDSYSSANVIHPPLPLKERNKTMIDNCGSVIGLPQTLNEYEDSPCWKTIRYSVGLDREVYVISPNGYCWGLE